MRHTAHMISLTILLVVVGLLAGVLAGLFGIGGGLLIVPSLTFLLLAQGQSPEWVVPTAIATSLGSMLLTSAGAVWAHHKKIGTDQRTLWQVAPMLMLGGGLGAWLTTVLPTLYVGLFFTVLVTLIGLRMGLAIAPQEGAREPRPRGIFLAGPIMGTSSAMVGIGGGSLLVPYLTWNGYQPVQAVALASACGWLLALAGTMGFALTEPAYLNPLYIGIIGVAGWISAPVGVALAHKLSATRLRRLFGLMLVAVAFRMLWQIYTAT